MQASPAGQWIAQIAYWNKKAIYGLLFKASAETVMTIAADPIRTNPGIFARLRSFAANILRFNQKRSISQDRYANALGGISHIARLAYK